MSHTLRDGAATRPLHGGLMACLLALAAHAHADTNPAAPSPSATRTLDGGCARDNDRYGCSWRGPSSDYIVQNLPQSDQEVWSACFEREGIHGPEKHCTGGVRRVGDERAADLAAATSGLNERALPQGWTALSLPVLPGSFQQQGNRDIALLMYQSHEGQDDQYGLVVVPDASSSQPAKVVKTFTDKGPNAPRLSLVKPGSYAPVCHDGGHCAPVMISNEAIGLCFGEASCEIIYFDAGAYRELFVTD
ncbi:hypothetical protein JOD97_003175 [Duganella sp. 1411]|uniref:hypothetical protein n=1 Tax=Duganella sp. 1411 TaxID=2806572 RepID=UPI001AEB4463|nr:hypothetical protein [Duganella sp. 1411]MBP1205133.1 hypothetical protein [Duganella sp. 1411]